MQEDLIRSVIDNFNRLDEFEPSQIFPQMRDRLNQWMLQSRPAEHLAARSAARHARSRSSVRAPLIAHFTKNLETGLFTVNDMIGLQEAIWLRDIAKNARGSQLDDLSIAEALFDWTVRNLQLVEDPPAGTPPVEHSPAEMLLLGRATARERAWIFLLLLRQQGLDGVMLAIAWRRQFAAARVVDGPGHRRGSISVRSVAGHAAARAAEHRVATLADVAADDELLRKLDLSSTRPYPVKAEQLAHLIAYVEASPVGLSRRMETLEGRLTGDQRVILTARPKRLAERLAGRSQIEQVRYWPLPYEYWRARGALKPGQPPQAAAELMVFQVVRAAGQRPRSLQFKGVVDGERGAKAYYLASPPNEAAGAPRLPPRNKRSGRPPSKTPAIGWA